MWHHNNCLHIFLSFCLHLHSISNLPYKNHLPVKSNCLLNKQGSNSMIWLCDSLQDYFLGSYRRSYKHVLLSTCFKGKYKNNKKAI